MFTNQQEYADYRAERMQVYEGRLVNPISVGARYWPSARLYDKQFDILESVRYSKETIVHAGNMLGKDWIGGYIATTFFLAPQMYFDMEYVQSIEDTRSPENPYPHTCRVVTTSVAEHHLKVLWGEIGRFATSAVEPLLFSREAPDAPLVINYQEMRYTRERWAKNPLNYCQGRVSETGEGMAGHHAAYTLGIIDEGSGVADLVYTQMGTWAKKILIIGNPNPTANFFRKGVKAGNQLRE